MGLNIRPDCTYGGDIYDEADLRAPQRFSDWPCLVYNALQHSRWNTLLYKDNLITLQVIVILRVSTNINDSNSEPIMQSIHVVGYVYLVLAWLTIAVISWNPRKSNLSNIDHARHVLW